MEISVATPYGEFCQVLVNIHSENVINCELDLTSNIQLLESE